jgi:hypothetical protein
VTLQDQGQSGIAWPPRNREWRRDRAAYAAFNAGYQDGLTGQPTRFGGYIEGRYEGTYQYGYFYAQGDIRTGDAGPVVSA